MFLECFQLDNTHTNKDLIVTHALEQYPSGLDYFYNIVTKIKTYSENNKEYKECLVYFKTYFKIYINQLLSNDLFIHYLQQDIDDLIYDTRAKIYINNIVSLFRDAEKYNINKDYLLRKVKKRLIPTKSTKTKKISLYIPS